MKIPILNDFESLFNDPVWLEIGAEICRRNLIRFGNLTRAEHGENIVIFVDDEFILKIYTPKKMATTASASRLRSSVEKRIYRYLRSSPTAYSKAFNI